MTDRCRDLIWQCETQNIDVFIRTHVPEREHCHYWSCGRIGNRMTPASFPPNNRGTEGNNNDEGNRNCCERSETPESLGSDSQCSRICFPFQSLQISSDVRGMLISNFTILLYRLVDDAFHFLWDFRIQAHGRSWSTIQNAIKNNARCITTKGQASGCHLVQHHAERE